MTRYKHQEREKKKKRHDMIPSHMSDFPTHLLSFVTRFFARAKKKKKKNSPHLDLP